VPLRPVSELGLVDVTDLASRKADDTVPARSSARAPKPKRSDRADSSSGTSKAASSRTPKRTARTSGGTSSGTPRTPSSTRAAARTNASSSARADSGASSKRRESRQGSQRKRHGESRGIQNARPHGEIKALAANLGVGAVTGALGVAGGVLLVRTARQRPRRILGILLPA
jgi:hypothetical protein